MTRSVRLALFLLLAVAAALALRCPQLGIRPMHNDEAVNAIKFQPLLEKGIYKYDPHEYHGPALPYATLLWSKLTRGNDFLQFDESRFRIVTLLFGVGMILLLPLIVDGLGRSATVWAALFIAISPAMVFYSRYYIHEMLLVFFTLLGLAAGWRYYITRKIGWVILAGAAIGLMQATKETFVLTLAAIVGALILNTIWIRRSGIEKTQLHFKPIYPHLVLALSAWLLVSVLLFSSFFTNPNGPLDAIRTYFPWLHRAGGASPHIHPWNFYLSHLLLYHPEKGTFFTEALIFVLALIGGATAFTRKGTPAADTHFIRFLAFYSLLLTAIYSLIAYKTPWCLLSFWIGMLLLAGVGAMTLLQFSPSRVVKFAAIFLLLIGAAHLSLQAWQAGTIYSTDRRNPYIYAQTSPDILNLVAKIKDLEAASKEKNHLLIKTMAPGSEYWPLPYYLRNFDNTGWYSEIPSDPYAPIMIVSADLKANLDKNKTHLMVGLFELRPKIFFELYVERDLWLAYLHANKSNSTEL